MSAFLMNRDIVLVGLNRIPFMASGIKRGMMAALKMRAERTAVFSPSPRMFRAFSSGRVDANITGTIAKYFATSLAMLNVVTAPRVMSSCFPSMTTSMILAGLDSKSTMLAASLAACVPEFIASPTSATAKAGASLVPSPIIATTRVSACSFITMSYLSSGFASGLYSSIPTSLASEVGIDEYRPEAKPEDKYDIVMKEQAETRVVAMIGDGTNDAPALAVADVGLAMNSGTQAAKEAANMVDLESNPAKIIEVVMLGKQLLMTRGAVTTFSIANDVAKYFAIVPVLFASTIPELKALNVLGLGLNTAVLSALIFNAIIIPLLIPLAMRGVTFKPSGTMTLFLKNTIIYGIGGVIVPFVGIKLIDAAISLL